MAGPPPVLDKLAPPALPNPAMGVAKEFKSKCGAAETAGACCAYPAPDGSEIDGCGRIGGGIEGCGWDTTGAGAAIVPYNNAARARAAASAVLSVAADGRAAAACASRCNVDIVSATVVVLFSADVSTRNGVAVPGRACCTAIIDCKYGGAVWTVAIAVASAGVCGLDTTSINRGGLDMMEALLITVRI